MLFPIYAALAAAILFYLFIPLVGAFRLRAQWHRFRDRVALLGLAPRLRYRDLAEARREGRKEIGRFRLGGTIEVLEGADKVWVRGPGVSALVDLSRAPLYVLAPGPAEAGSVRRMSWSSVSSLVEGTRILVAGLLVEKEGRPIFVDRPDEALIAVCHDGSEAGLVSRLTAAGRAPNEYWNYPTRVSLAIGLVALSAILLLFRNSAFSTVRGIVFLAGASPVLPFAPPGLAFFLIYHRLWRRALASRAERDLVKLPLRYAAGGDARSIRYERRILDEGEAPPPGATRIGPRFESEGKKPRSLFAPESPREPDDEIFLIEGDPEELARKAEREAFIYAGAAGLAFGLAILINFALGFLIWRIIF